MNSHFNDQNYYTKIKKLYRDAGFRCMDMAEDKLPPALVEEMIKCPELLYSFMYFSTTREGGVYWGRICEKGMTEEAAALLRTKYTKRAINDEDYLI